MSAENNPSIHELHDIVPTIPPTEKITDDGIIIKTIASRIGEEYEYTPFARLVIAPTNVAVQKAKEIAESKNMDSVRKSPWPPGTLITGVIGTRAITHEYVPDRQPWYKKIWRSKDEQIAIAEKRISEIVFQHLRLP